MKTFRERNFITVALCIASLALLAFATTMHAQSVETGIIRLAHSSIEYFSRGKDETIVLLPGGTLTVDYLNGLADALAKQGYRVVGINFRGSGKSTGSSKGVTLRTMADDVAGVIEALKLGPVHMVGNDFCNRVARMFAASYPALTRSVILLAAGGKIVVERFADRRGERAGHCARWRELSGSASARLKRVHAGCPSRDN